MPRCSTLLKSKPPRSKKIHKEQSSELTLLTSSLAFFLVKSLSWRAHRWKTKTTSVWLKLSWLPSTPTLAVSEGQVEGDCQQARTCPVSRTHLPNTLRRKKISHSTLDMITLNQETNNLTTRRDHWASHARMNHNKRLTAVRNNSGLRRRFLIQSCRNNCARSWNKERRRKVKRTSARSA